MNQTQLPKLINEIPLETRALDNEGTSYKVSIRRSLIDPSLDEPILDIKGTPVKYFINGPNSPEKWKHLAIDAGQGWLIVNFDKIIDEVEKIMEEISMIKKSNILL
jgi:hypothetical protein